MNSDIPAPVSRVLQNEASSAPEKLREHPIDFSVEHTNGRMFEQAVQNANKTHETSASPNNIHYADSKVDQKAKSGNEKPLVLNDKDPRQEEALNTKEKKKKVFDGEEALRHALTLSEIDYEKLSDLSKDMISLKGERMNEIRNEKHTIPDVEIEEHSEDSHAIRIGASNAKDGSMKSKREAIHALAIEVHQNLIKIEADFDNHIKVSLMRQLDEVIFGKAVTNCLFS